MLPLSVLFGQPPPPPPPPPSRLLEALFSSDSLTGIILALAIAAILCWLLAKPPSSGPPSFTSVQIPGTEDGNGHIRIAHERLPMSTIRQRARAFFELHNQRRSHRMFSPDPVPTDVLEDLVRSAGTAPSGAHCQPWFFAIVKDASLKRQIRAEVEREEKLNYEKRMRKTWVDDVSHLVNFISDDKELWKKPYLEVAPALIVVFKQPHGVGPEGERVDHYYPNESVGIACGMLLNAIHNANLVTLTSTPMGAERAIRELLGRPDHEKVFLLLPVGFPAADACLPHRTDATLRKPLRDILKVH
jgi:iodotyrosine deiodinase